MLRQKRIKELEKFALSVAPEFNQDEEAVLAAAMFLIQKSNVSCTNVIFKKCGKEVTINMLKDTVFLIGSFTGTGYINIINSLCVDRSSWKVETITVLGVNFKFPIKSNAFAGNISDINDIITMLGGALVDKALYLTGLNTFEDYWNTMNEKKAVQILKANYPCYGSDEDKDPTVPQDPTIPAPITPKVQTKTDPNTCEGWDTYIARTEGRSTIPNDGYNVVTMFYTKRHDGTSYGDGEKVRSAFSQYVDVCKRYPTCRYENFVAWYKFNAEVLGRQFDPAEAVTMMDNEMKECLSNVQLEEPKREERTAPERRTPERKKERECNKDWETSYVERLVTELLNQNEPIVMAGPEDFPGSFTQVVSEGKARRLTARYIRRMFPGIQRISGENIRAVASEVTRRLKENDPGTGRYCRSTNPNKDIRDQLNRARVFFALQDEFKGRRRPDYDYKDYKKTDRQLQRGSRRRQRNRFMRELPQSGPAPRNRRRRLFR